VDDQIYLPGSGLLAEVDISALKKDGDIATFEFEDRLGVPKEGFVVLHKGEFYAYENRCPHWSVPITDRNELFHDNIGLIICPLHGATFEMNSGTCISGPCEGDALVSMRVEKAKNLVSVYAKGLKFT
jgi:nitrite reductase/ring-hydroxylating ferredoxin subunit